MAFLFMETKIPGVMIIQPQVFGDERGYFMETFKKTDYSAAGIDKEFVQDNESSSTKGVLRGLHFQKDHTQGKLVRVTRGEVFDVAVDVRPGSETYGQWVGVTLSSAKKNMLYNDYVKQKCEELCDAFRRNYTGDDGKYKISGHDES